jgi:CRISPR-associated protein Csx14
MVGGADPRSRSDRITSQPGIGGAEGASAMTRTNASIPVDLTNPGQVLACVGALEAAEALCGGAEAHFDWSGAPAQFVLCADSDKDPFEVVLDFLAAAKVVELTPIGYVEGGAADVDDGEEDATRSEPEDDQESDDSQDATNTSGRVTVPAFPSGEGDRNALPIQLVGFSGLTVIVSHWAESRRSARPWLSRNAYKLYSGNRSARKIADQLLGSFREMWNPDSKSLVANPFEKTVPLGGSFNFDARRAWTGIDTGFSPDQQKKNKMIAGVAGSPVVEMLAAIGLEHTRPNEYETRKVRYAVWGSPLPPMLGRAAFAGADLKMPMRRFEFELDLSGKNKVTTFAQEETQP